MPKENITVSSQIKLIRLEKFDNDENGNPVKDSGPIEIWEGSDEQELKCVFKKVSDNAS